MRHSFPSRRLDSRPLDLRRSEPQRPVIDRLDSSLLGTLWNRVLEIIGLKVAREVRTKQSRRRARSWFGSFAGAIVTSERPAQRNSVFEACEPRLVLTPNVWLVGVDLEGAEVNYPGTVNPGMLQLFRDGPTTSNLVVYFSTSGSATYGGATPDYSLYQPPNQVTIPAGSSSRLVSVSVINDGLVEPTEQAIITLVLDPNFQASYQLSTEITQTVEIADNNSVEIWLEAVVPEAYEEDTVPGVFRFHRNGPINVAVTVEYEVTEPWDAIPGLDYDELLGFVDIPIGASYVDVMVYPYDDSEDEPLEVVEVVLLDPPPAGYTFGTWIDWVWIYDNDAPAEEHAAPAQNEPLECSCSCSCENTTIEVNQLTGDLEVNQKLLDRGTLAYSTATDPFHRLFVDFIRQASEPQPVSLKAQVKLGDWTGPLVHFNPSNLVSGTSYRFILQADGTDLDTGLHPWEMLLYFVYPDGSKLTRRYSGDLPVVNRNTSPFGRNWWPSELDILAVDRPGGVLHVTGKGAAQWWQEVQAGVFQRPLGEPNFSTLMRSGANYVFTTRDQFVKVFNNLGRLTDRYTPQGAHTQYDYNTSGSLSQITDEVGHTYQFAYDGNRLDFIDKVYPSTSETSRLEFGGNGALITTIVEPDPNLIDGLAPPQTSFLYDWYLNYPVIIQQPEDKASIITYTSRAVERVAHIDGTSYVNIAQGRKGLVDPALGQGGTESNPAALFPTSRRPKPRPTLPSSAGSAEKSSGNVPHVLTARRAPWADPEKQSPYSNPSWLTAGCAPSKLTNGRWEMVPTQLTWRPGMTGRMPIPPRRIFDSRSRRRALKRRSRGAVARQSWSPMSKAGVAGPAIAASCRCRFPSTWRWWTGRVARCGRTNEERSPPTSSQSWSG